MALSKVQKAGIAALSLAAIFTAASPAFALEPKQCLPLAEMNAALKAEGQRTLIVGNREALQNPTGQVKDASVHKFLNTVTGNSDGSEGYQLEGDLPRTENSTKICVGAKLTNIRLFDARRPGVPQGALLGGKFDDAVRSYEREGTRPMVIADTLHKSADGNYRTGLPMALLGNMEKSAALMYTRLPDGRPQEMLLMGDVEYTQTALNRLGTQVAMRSPN